MVHISLNENLRRIVLEMKDSPFCSDEEKNLIIKEVSSGRISSKTMRTLSKYLQELKSDQTLHSYLRGNDKVLCFDSGTEKEIQKV
jgi:hypothetical protein